MTPPLLLVRADAAADIGTGHVMRTLALAQFWMLAGGHVTYVTATLPDALAARLDSEGVDRLATQTVPGSEADAARVAAIADADGATAIVVDGYHFGEPFRKRLAQTRAQTLLVHDFEVSDTLWLDGVLNQNAHASPAHYPRVERSRMLLGPRFALLRREFADRAARTPPVAASPPMRLLVTMGGGDEHNVTALVVRALDRLAVPLQVTVLTGGANSRAVEVRRLAGRSAHPVQVLHDVRDVARVMAVHDIAVSAAGSTAWELACLGVPWLSIAVADNQVPIQDELHRLGVAVSLGWWQQLDEARVGSAVEQLLGSGDRRSAMSGAALRLVDSGGAARVAAALMGQG